VTRDELEKARAAAGAPVVDEASAEANSLPAIDPPQRAASGSRPGLPIPGGTQPGIGGPRNSALRVEYGDVELLVEHRGDDVSIVIPGALRLTAPRSQAMALVAALMKRP
jgi:hypothetical protein